MRVQVALDLSNTSDVDVCVDADNYTSLITNSTNFKAPAVSAAMAAIIVEVVNNTKNASTALKNAIAAPVSSTRLDTIYSKRAEMDTNLTALASLVEMVANDAKVKDVDRVGIIHSAGMDEKNHAIRQKQVFDAKTGKLPGEVDLTATGLSRGAHEWQYTADLSGQTGWVSSNTTLQASTTIKGLVSGQEYAFRHRTIEKDGPTEWEDFKTARAK